MIHLVIVSPPFYQRWNKGKNSLINTHIHSNTSVETSTGSNSRLDIPAVAQLVQTYLAWPCQPGNLTMQPQIGSTNSVVANINSPFPVSEKLPCCFDANPADANLASHSKSLPFSAVCNLQLSLGLLNPHDHSSLPILKLKQMIGGISRLQLPKGSQCSKPHLPITGQLLIKIHSSLISQTTLIVIIWAIYSLAFFGFYHLGELLIEIPITTTKPSIAPTVRMPWC